MLGAIVLLLLPTIAEAGWVADLTWTPSGATTIKTGTKITRQAAGGVAVQIGLVPAPGAAFTDGGTTVAGPIVDGVAYTWCAVETNGAGDALVKACASQAGLSVPDGAVNMGIQLRRVPTAP
jgi:hypothetical protein